MSFQFFIKLGTMPVQLYEVRRKKSIKLGDLIYVRRPGNRWEKWERALVDKILDKGVIFAARM